MIQPFRMPSGGQIDRTRLLSFTFDGRPLTGYAGDSVAAALLANGVRIIGRSFKYHRPRGIVGAGYEDAGVLVDRVAPGAATNQLPTVMQLADGLTLASINSWPSARFDLGALAGFLAPLIPAGFYYKTFMWPHWLWFEPWIRKAAGLGAVGADASALPDLSTETRFGHADVVVVGGGPTGLVAALTAGRAGARVVLVDDGDRLGGRLLADGDRIDGEAPEPWIEAIAGELARLSNVTVMAPATAWGYHEHNLMTVLERAPPTTGLTLRNWKIRCGRVIIATGAIERPIPFADNDRPGVMLASAVRTYLRRYAVLPGRQPVVFTNNCSGWDTALMLGEAGCPPLVIDARPAVPADLLDAAAALDLRVIAGGVVERALGGRSVTGVAVRDKAGLLLNYPADLVAVSGGWNPAIHLASQSREARSVFDPSIAGFLAQHASHRFALAGAAAGRFDLADCLRDGRTAGLEALAAIGRTPGVAVDLPTVAPGRPLAILPLWLVPGPSKGAKVFVDATNDVTARDLGIALGEGYDSIELVKRYTTAGMGVDQGKTANANVIGVVAGISGTAPGAVGTTTFRPPYSPVEFGPLVSARHGPLLYPFRHAPLTEWHVAHGAVMYEAGARWQRPGYYLRDGETMAAAIAREVRAVRHGVGVYDGSPLGKFQVKGPGAAAFIDRLYVSDFATLKPGRGRYSVMLTEDGLPLDDGVTFRLDAHRWLVHSTTGNADRIHRHLEEVAQIHCPDLGISITPVTAQWVNATICGPRARDLMARLDPDFDVGGATFRFMDLREGRLGGLPVRVMRVSWTGELSFEINTPARHGRALWTRILEAGADMDIQPVGSEANHVMRVEAGYISFGHEVDGDADIVDIGLGGLVSTRKDDFIGKRGMAIRRRHAPLRREFVGFLPDDPVAIIPDGAPITPNGARADSEGFVSACIASETVGRTIALGLLMNGRARLGETVHARAHGRVIPLRVVAPVFHDADRARVKA